MSIRLVVCCLYVSVSVVMPLWVSAQVIIRDTVRLELPGEVISPTASVSGSTLTAELSYAGAVQSSRATVLFIDNRPCGFYADQVFGTDNFSLSAPARVGRYDITYRFSPRGGQGGQYRVRVLLDGAVIRADSFVVNCAQNCTILGFTDVTLVGGFGVSVSANEIDHGGEVSFSVQAVAGSGCSDVVWHPAAPIRLEITDGSELGEFVDAEGNSLGRSFTGSAAEIGRIRFRANGRQPSTQGGGGDAPGTGWQWDAGGNDQSEQDCCTDRA